jgi:hypothetical protein
MAQPSRTAQIARIHKVLKKYYKPVNPAPDRSVIEHLLFACCLENAPYDAAEEAFAALSHNFFDWNEIRVSTVRELAEEMPRLPDPSAAGQRIKRVLQSIFDATYAFDLEDLHKLNLGPAAEKLAKLDGATPFSVAYVVQAALAGHAIPIDQGTVKALEAADMITPEEIQSGQINGLERAITKPKGFEFASLLHQLGADFIANPQSPALVQILVDLNPAIAERAARRPKKVDDAQRQPAAKGNAAAGQERPPQSDAGEGEPEAKKKRSETRRKIAEKPAPPGRHEPPQAEAQPLEPKPAEAKAAEAKHHEPKPTEAKPAETKRPEAKRAAGPVAPDEEPQAKAHDTPAKGHAAKATKAATGDTKPAEAKAPTSKTPSTKAAEAKGAEQKSSGKHEAQPAQPSAEEPRASAERKKKPHEEPPVPLRKKPVEEENDLEESSSVKRKPATCKKGTPAKKETPAVEPKEHPGGEKEKKTAATP